MNLSSVVILHYGSVYDTKLCLSSIRENESENLKIIIVNNSKDTLSEIIGLREGRKIKIIDSRDNSGFARGVNTGIRILLKEGCKNIILLNNDTIIAKNSLSSMIDYGSINESVGIISPKIYFTKGKEFHADKYKREEKGKVIWYAGGQIDWANVYAHHRGVDEVDIGHYDTCQETDFATGCCMLIKNSVFEKIGFFDERYFLYYEDVDFSLRAAKAGMKIIYYPKSHIWHSNAKSSGGSGSKIHVYYQTRNRLYFGMKYANLRVKKSLILQSMRNIFSGYPESKAVFDYYRGKMGKAIL